MNKDQFFKELLQYYYPKSRLEDVTQTAGVRIKYLDLYISSVYKDRKPEYKSLLNRILKTCSYMPTVADLSKLMSFEQTPVLEAKFKEVT